MSGKYLNSYKALVKRNHLKTHSLYIFEEVGEDSQLVIRRCSYQWQFRVSEIKGSFNARA